jgi:hypothetical protein
MAKRICRTPTALKHKFAFVLMLFGVPDVLSSGVKKGVISRRMEGYQFWKNNLPGKRYNVVIVISMYRSTASPGKIVQFLTIQIPG